MHSLCQVALRHRGDRSRNLRRRPQEIVHQRVDGHSHLAPRPLRLVKPSPFAGPALFSDHLPHALQFLRDLLVRGNDLVEGIGNLACGARPMPRQSHREISIPHGLQAGENQIQLRPRRSRSVTVFSLLFFSAGCNGFIGRRDFATLQGSLHIPISWIKNKRVWTRHKVGSDGDGVERIGHSNLTGIKLRGHRQNRSCSAAKHSSSRTESTGNRL